jgi:hypothetical protein
LKTREEKEMKKRRKGDEKEKTTRLKNFLLVDGEFYSGRNYRLASTSIRADIFIR